MEDNFNYIEEANVTMSDNFHFEKVSQELFVDVLDSAIEALNDLDQIKKALFYGRDMNESLTFAEQGVRNNDIQIHGLHPDPQAGMRLLHGIIGIATEAGEMLEALRQGVEGGVFDLTNVAEEVGDNQWYAAAILRVLGTTFDDVQRTNIAKLRARFPNKFDAHDANNRNLERERKILERKDLNQIFNEHEAELQKANTKPIVQIKNWSIVGNRLFGIALNHPRAPNGGESDVSTTRILSQEGNRVETVNTIYELIGDTVTEQT